MTSIVKLTNGLLCDEGKLYTGDLWIDIDAGVIISTPALGVVYETIDMAGQVVAPGFIDIQINGAFGFDFSRSVTNSQEVQLYAAEYEVAMAKYLSTGVTSVCPTLTSSFPEVYHNVLPLVGRSRETTRCDSLGAHCEGPFISSEKKGCHPVECLVAAPERIASMEGVYGSFDNIAIVTVAPEVVGVLDCIPELVSSDVTVAIGHTTASYEVGLQAVQHGAGMVTHMYNAMPQPHHRTPGIFGLLGMLKTEGEESTIHQVQRPYYGLVADGVHLHHTSVRIAYRSSPERCILVTDAMLLIGLPNGIYEWDNQKIVKEGKRLHLQGTSTIAGSSTDLSECVRNLMRWCDVDLATAIQTVTNNPARSLKVEKAKGFLRPGCDADLTVLDLSGKVQRVFKLGQEVHLNPKLRAVL